MKKMNEISFFKEKKDKESLHLSLLHGIKNRQISSFFCSFCLYSFLIISIYFELLFQ